MRARLGYLLCLVILAACRADFQALALKFSSPAERQFATHYLQLWARGDTDSALTFLVPELRRDSSLRVVAPRIESLLAGGKLDSLHIIGVSSSTTYYASGPASRDVMLSFEGPATSGGWIVASVTTQYRGDTAAVSAFSVYPTPEPLESINAFTFRGRKPLHFLWLALAAVMLVCSIGTSVLVFRARMPRRWLWAAIALVATPVFALDWTAGHAAIQHTVLLLFGASAVSSGPASPWIVSFGVPTGAIVSYFRLRAWREGKKGRGDAGGVAA